MTQNQLHQYMIIKLVIVVNSGDKDLSDATVKKLIISRPDKTVFTVNLTFTTDGSDGSFYYNTDADDLDQVGIYNYQVYLEYNGNEAYSNIGKFRVHPNLATI